LTIDECLTQKQMIRVGSNRRKTKISRSVVMSKLPCQSYTTERDIGMDTVGRS
jgi:hypothetical protein